MEYGMTTKHKVEVKPWRPKMQREPEFNPFVNPLDRELENPRPLEESESEDGESAQNTGGAADAERWGRFEASV
jgi:hypothetical protein